MNTAIRGLGSREVDRPRDHNQVREAALPRASQITTRIELSIP
jgi:hypothetical protein